jgi:hypothetical protein
MPAANRAQYMSWDYMWNGEICKGENGMYGFHGIDQWSAGHTAEATELQNNAATVLIGLPPLRACGGRNLRLLLGDIEAWAHLGNYYACKALSANVKATNKTQALQYMTTAIEHWRRYAAVHSWQYAPQLLARDGWANVRDLFDSTKKDITLLGGTPGAFLVTATPGGTILEAETATISKGTAASAVAGFTSTGYADFQNATGGSVAWTFNAAAAGEYVLELRYLLASGVRPVVFAVNQVAVPDTLVLWTTGGAASWAWDRKVVNLRSGANTIKVTAVGATPPIDHLNILSYGAVASNSRLKAFRGITVSETVSRSAIRFSLRLAESGPVTLTVYDLKGRRIRELLRRRLDKGLHIVSWDLTGANGRSAASGTGYYTVAFGTAAAPAITKRVTFVR